MPYFTVFDISQKPFEWWWPAVGLIFVILGVAVIKYGKWLSVTKDSKIMGWCFVVFGSGAAVVIFILMYSTYSEYVGAYRTGQYSVVEGVVEDFHPMPYEGHQNECFRVNKAKFCYSDYEVSPAFNQTASHGGPIRAGLPVRIAYIEDESFNAHILRLEIRADMMPSQAERSAFSKSEETKWKRWVKENPQADQFGLGFCFAALLISLFWNLDWRHYIKYWIRRDPPYSQFLELGFRAFFLVCLAGAGTQLIRMLMERHRTISDFEKAGLFSLIWIGFFGISDIIFRRHLRVDGQDIHERSSASHQ